MVSICSISVSSFLGSSTLNHNGFTIFGIMVGKIGMPGFMMNFMMVMCVFFPLIEFSKTIYYLVLLQVPTDTKIIKLYN